MEKYTYKLVPTIDRVNLITDKEGQYWIAYDYWRHSRWNSASKFILSWKDQHIYDQRYSFLEDDSLQTVYPEVDSPWKFPDNVFVSSLNLSSDLNYNGLMLEPAYFATTPNDPPIGYMLTVQNGSLPEAKMRFVEVSDIPVQAVQWGPHGNIPKDTMLFMAPMAWQGTRGPELGEEWENTPAYKTVITAKDGELDSYSKSAIANVPDNFPNDPNMPHGDADPYWDDGLDETRITEAISNRKKYAHKRGTSDRFISTWASYSRPVEMAVDANGNAVITVAQPVNTRNEQLRSQYEFSTYAGDEIVWADPAHFNEINLQNFPRLMRSCLTCFNAYRCKKANSALRYIDKDNIPSSSYDKVFSLGFMRNHYVDVPAALNPDTPAGQLWSTSFCGYSIGSAWEYKGRNKPSFDEMETVIKSADAETLINYLKKYDSVSDNCHLNGMSKRAVEYDGHYRLLAKEIALPLMRDMRIKISNALKNNSLYVPFPHRGGNINCLIQPAGKSYKNDWLYKLVYTGGLPFPDINLGQYGLEYGVNEDYDETPIIAWFSTRYDPISESHIITKCWAYIWYISNHTDRVDRVKIKRLVEVKPDYGNFYGNAIQVKSDIDFSGGSSNLNFWNINENISKFKPKYVPTAAGWVKLDQGFDLANFARSIYKDPSGCFSQGTVTVQGLPGDIIPYDFLTYAPPKVIKWDYSDTDRNTQDNIGKTRFYWNERNQRYERGVGDLDDLFYHLSYQNPEISSGALPNTINPNMGAMTNYTGENPPGLGFLQRDMSASGFSSDNSAYVDDAQSHVALANTYKEFVNVPEDIEKNSIDQGRLVLASDMQHARNFTAPIFAYQLSPDLPLHHVVSQDYNIQRMDWPTRELEPIEVAAQREYCKVPAVWCFAQNSTNRETNFTINTGSAQKVPGAEGKYPIKIIHHPAGRTWWHKKGLLGCMVEKNADGSNFTQDGIAIINMWRKIIPHHMEVVRAYLFLEPTLDHFVDTIFEYNNRTLPGFDPFQGITLEYDRSESKLEAGDNWFWANFATRVHNANQFLGGRIVGEDVNAQRDSGDIWENEVKPRSPSIVGDWQFRHNQPLDWDFAGGTISDWELYHVYDRASAQSDIFLYDNVFLTLTVADSANNQQTVQIFSQDQDDPGSLAQRDPKWYNNLALLYEDDQSTFNDIEISANGVQDRSRSYKRNANVFYGINRSFDLGEGPNGKPDPLGKGLGFSKRAGAWKAPYIFDITPYVQKAYANRFDAEFITLMPKNFERRQTWREN